MINDMLVVDAIIHPYNLSPANQTPGYESQLEAVYAAHRMSFDAQHGDYLLNEDEFFSDFPYEAIARAEFVESPVDFAIAHSLPSLGFCKTFLNDPTRTGAFAKRYPHRVKMYACVSTPDVKAAVKELEWQIKEFGVDSLKLYPAFYYEGSSHGWRLDGDEFAVPLLEAAQKLGIKHVAIHKALWLPPAPKECFNPMDMDTPMARFPELSFEIVHAGTAFIDETLQLLERHPNLYLTLETMFAYILVKPKLFGKILGKFLKNVGTDRLLFATGNNLAHPDPILKAFADYTLPDDVLQEVGCRQLTADDRRAILGLNAIRLHGLNADNIRANTADDDFARARAAGVPPPWGALRG